MLNIEYWSADEMPMNAGGRFNHDIELATIIARVDKF
jgi:hypothetical protein